MNYVPCKLALAALPVERERSAGTLKSLVDLAYAAGDVAFAAHLINRLYAHYDRQECVGSA